MPSDLSIACALDGPRAADRMTEMAALGRDGLLESRVDGARARLLFAAEVQDRVERIVAAERECCAFLAFRLVPEAEHVELVVDAPDEAAPALHEWVRAFTAGR